jgi:hypothetical protein
VNGINTSTIQWGTPVWGGSQSSYSFTGTAPPPFTVTPEVAFNLGTFIHNNQPITSNSLTLKTAKLEVNTTLDFETTTEIITSVFDFSHWETPNSDSPCANGGSNNSGVNQNGCADRVTFALNLAQTDSFMIGDKEYVINLSGFQVGGSLASEFWTKESQSNSAFLTGKIVEKSSVVPVPAAVWLFGSALMGFMGVGYRRKVAA